MARSPEDLRRLARELAASALTPEERARVLAEAAPRDRLRPPSFTPPLLAGGTRWIGGTSGARACTATMAADPVFIDTNVLDATVTPMTVRDLQLSYFAADTPETWVDRMEAACRILEEAFPTEDLRVGSTMRRRWRFFGEIEHGPVRFVRERRRFFEQVLQTQHRVFNLHSGDPNLGERCDRPIRFEGYEPRGTLDTIVQLGGSIGGGHAGLFSFSAFIPDCGWERIERLLAQLGDASGAFTAHLSPRETEDRLWRVQCGAGSWIPIQPTEPESRLPKIVYCVYGGREAREQPWFLGWLNYWSDATARFLGFPDPDRDAELLANSYRTPAGAWLVKLGPDPLDHRIAAHVELLGRAYARFPRLGVRAPPRSP